MDQGRTHLVSLELSFLEESLVGFSRKPKTTKVAGQLSNKNQETTYANTWFWLDKKWKAFIVLWKSKQDKSNKTKKKQDQALSSLVRLSAKRKEKRENCEPLREKKKRNKKERGRKKKEIKRIKAKALITSSFFGVSCIIK